ncbi:Ribosomal protein L11 methyltransferase [Nymphon striatum]|nr:Ribosomal protein L11 methyltransferase [Nymphon striatum]
MSQSLISLRAGKTDAERIFSLLESEFEDDGFGIAVTEIDEDADIHEVSLYVATDETLITTTSERIQTCIKQNKLVADLKREDLPDIDWVAKSLEGIEIDAGQAFGTGHHGTTSGCLIMLEQLLRKKKPKVSLDLGTGSAVLAIAIAKLVHTPILATDIDPIATKVARANVELNGEARAIECETAIGLKHEAFRRAGPFDLIVANILPWPLMAMALDIERNLAPNGDVILSGILTHQRNMVLAKFRNIGLVHVKTIEREGWVTIHLKR